MATTASDKAHHLKAMQRAIDDAGPDIVRETTVKQMQTVRRPKRREIYAPDTRTPSGRVLPY